METPVTMSVANLCRFVSKVKAMRNAQKLFYSTKNFNTLAQAKAIEKEVDEFIIKADQSANILAKELIS